MRNRRLLISLLSGAAVLVAAAPAQAVVPTTARVSLDSSGAQINGYNALPVVSADGRWVAFDSYSDKVVAGDANGTRDVFLRDRQTGETRRISARPGNADANNASAGPSISADGRYVAFISVATNLSTGTQNASDDVYLYDRVANQLKRVSTSTTGNDGNGVSSDPMVANDGSAVVFASTATDLVAGDGNGKQDVFHYNVASGALQKVSLTPGTAPTSNGDSYGADVSDNGRFVSFTSAATNMLGVGADTNGFTDVFVRDMQTGTNTRVSVTSAGGEGNNTSSRSSISGDGCFVAFGSSATNLASNDDKATRVKAMVRDRCKNTTEIASLGNDGALANTNGGRRPYVSDDGCIVSFVSSSLAGGATWGAFARDRCKGFTSRLDVDNGGAPSAGGVDFLQLSPGKGRYAAFDSGADNLVPGDTNKTFDAFVRDRGDAAPPAADLKVSVDGMRVKADGTGSRDSDGAIASAKVSFGDGTPEENGLNVSHTYTRAGSYTVTLIVTDDDGLTATASKPVTVVDSAGATPEPPRTEPQPLPLPKPTPKTPKLAQLKLSGGTVANGRRGVQFAVASSEVAKGKVTVQRRVKRGKKLVWTKVTALSASLKKGANTVALAKPGAIPAGSYRVVATAKTKDGRATSKQLIRTFTITLKKKEKS